MQDDGRCLRKKWKMVKTVCLVAAWLSMGMYMGLIGAALIDLTEIANCNYEQLADTMTANNVGYIVATLGYALLCSRFRRHLEAILGINFILLGLSTAAVPWCSLLPLMAIAMIVQGLAYCVLDVAGNSWMAIMWEESAAGPLHALHFGYAFGRVVSALVIQHFLSPDANPLFIGNHSPATENFTTNKTAIHSSSRIQIPFGGYGLYSVFWGLLFLFFYIVDRRSPENKGLFVFGQGNQNILNEEVEREKDSCAGVNKSFGIFMTVVLCLMYVCITGLYTAIPNYLMPLSTEGRLRLSKTAGNWLLFGYSVSLVLGRLLATILGDVSRHWALFTEVLVCFGLAIAMYLFSLNSVILMWILTCAFSFVTAPIFSAAIAWAGIYLEITGSLMTVFFFGKGLGGLLFNWLCGFGIENYGTDFPLGANLAAAAAATLLYFIAAVSCWYHGPAKSDSTELLEYKVAKLTVSNERQPLVN